MITITPVNSTTIARIEYNSETKMLIIHWTKGTQNAYENVPEEVHAAFISAESPGKFYHSEIRGKAQYYPVPSVETSASEDDF